MTIPPASPSSDAPGSGWALIRADGVIAAADAEFATRLGEPSATALVGRPWRDLVTPEGQRTLAEIERTVRGGRGWRGRLAGRAASGVVELEVEAAPGRDASIALRIVGTPPSTARGPAPSYGLEGPSAPEVSVEPAAMSAPAVDAAPRPPERAPAAPAEEMHAPTPEPPAVPSRQRGRPMRAALEEAARELGFELALALRVEDAGRALGIAEAYPDGIGGADPGVRWSPPDAAERAVLESGEPALEGTLAVHRGDTSPLARLPAYGFRSAVRVPLFTGGEVVAIVAAYATRPEAFSVDDALRLERAVRGLDAGYAPAPTTATGQQAPRETPSMSEPPPAPASSSAPAAPSMAEQFDRLGTLGELMAGVAHELNNPLTAVVGYAQALGSLPPAEQARALEVIEREALRAGRIVRNLLTFAQRHAPELTAVDLNAVVERVLELKRYALQMDNVAVEVERAPLPELRADEHQLEQALLNLVNNAHQAMAPRGGTLRVRTYLEGGRARVAVEDSGPGVPPALASRVFDPFFTTRGVGGGMGLGLAVVFGTVSAHGGRVWVEPAPSGGARFIIELPVAGAVAGASEPASMSPPASERPPAAASGSARGAGQRVLVVDDEEPIRVLATQVLTNFGYQAQAAASAAEALALLEQRPFEVIITDVRMPGMGGVELYRELARRWPQLADRVIVMTGDVENEAVASLLRERGLASLEKPFRLESLLAAVAAAVALRTAEG